MKTTFAKSIAASPLVIALAGCGADLIAPEGPQTNAFLNQVAARCGELTIGSQPIDYLLGVNADDAYFLDETSKLAAGDIGSEAYREDINAFYPTGDNQAALDCVVRQTQ